MSRKMSLTTNISLMVGVTVLIVGIVIYFYSNYRTLNLYESEKQRQIAVLADNISDGIRDYLAADDAQGITQAVGRVIWDKEEIQFCIVSNSSEEVVFDSALEKKGRKFDPMKHDWGSGVRLLKKNVESGKLNLGTLYIGYSIEPPVEAERARNFIYIGNFIASSVGNFIKEFDFAHVSQLLTRIGKSYPDILYITVYDEYGNVFDEYRRGTAKPPAGRIKDMAFTVNPLKPVLVQRYHGDKADILDISALAQSGDEAAGIVRLGYSTSGLEREIAEQQLRLAIVGLFFLAAGVLFSIVIARRVSGPVRIISDAAHEVGTGNLDVVVEVHSGGQELRQLAVNFNEMVAGLKERNLIRDTFSKYVSKQVALEILSNPDKVSLGGARKDVVTLFCDVRGFTNMSEQEPPEKVVEMLNEFFGEMVPVIFRYEGTLDKYIGDAFMAVFGSPVPVADSADKAVECAIEIQRRMKQLNSKWESEGKRTFGVGIGLNYGPVIAGNIGYEERMEYTVIGDSVNVAARVEKLTRIYNTNIIATKDLVDKTSGRFRRRLLDRLQVKGKDEFVEIFEIMDKEG